MDELIDGETDGLKLLYEVFFINFFQNLFVHFENFQMCLYNVYFQRVLVHHHSVVHMKLQRNEERLQGVSNRPKRGIEAKETGDIFKDRRRVIQV